MGVEFSVGFCPGWMGLTEEAVSLVFFLVKRLEGLAN